MPQQTAHLLINGDLHSATPPLCLPPTVPIIAVDGGMIHAQTLAVTPSLWIGDFDSCSTALQQRYAHIPRKTFPTAKAKLDTELALDHIVAQGITRVILWGALGGRLDHQLALQLLPLAYPNLHLQLTDGQTWFHSLSPIHAQTLHIAQGEVLSVLALSNVTGLSIHGAHWDLDAVSLNAGTGMGMSNIAKQTPIRIDCQQGSAWVIVPPACHVDPL